MRLLKISFIVLAFNTLNATCPQDLNQSIERLLNSMEYDPYETKIQKFNNFLRDCNIPTLKFRRNLLEIDHYLDENKLNRANIKLNRLNNLLNLIPTQKRAQYQKEYFKRMIRFYTLRGDNNKTRKYQIKLRDLEVQNSFRFKTADEIYNELNEGNKAAGAVARESLLLIPFEHAQSNLNQRAREQVDELKKALVRETIIMEPGARRDIKIIGYANTLGPSWSNNRLSKQRAETIKRALEANQTIREYFRISTEGKGETQPICKGEGYPIRQNNGEYQCSNNNENEEAGRRVRIILE